MRRRQSAVRDSTRVKNRLKMRLYYLGVSIPPEYEKRWSKPFIEWLKGLELPVLVKSEIDGYIRDFEHFHSSLLDIAREMRSVSHQPGVCEKVERIMTVPGVGLTFAMTLLAEIGDVKRFSNSDKLASFIGMVPMEHSSGEHKSVGKMTLRHNGYLKFMLGQAAWKAIRIDPALMASFVDQKKAGVKPQVAIVKIARKLVNRIFFVMKYEKNYDLGKSF